MSQHLATSTANERLAAKLAADREYGWSITCLFYSALHLVEAYLQQKGQASSNHVERRVFVRNEPTLTPIRRRYDMLKQESENARYECRVFSPAESTHMREFVYTPLASYMRNLLGVT